LLDRESFGEPEKRARFYAEKGSRTSVGPELIQQFHRIAIALFFRDWNDGAARPGFSEFKFDDAVDCT